MNEADMELTAKAFRSLEGLRWLHDETGRFLKQSGHQPSVGSIAQTESRIPELGKRAIDAHQQGTTLIEVAADHIQAFLKTLTNPVQTIAPFGSVRSVMECCALASWLLDPDIEVRTRVQRSLAFRFEGLTRQATFGEDVSDTDGTTRVRLRMEKIKKEAIKLGFSPVPNKKQRLAGIGQRMPTITDVISETLNEKPVYRLLSAVVHAHLWALLQVSFRPVGDHKIEQEICDCHTAGETYFRKDMAIKSAQWLSLKIVTCFAKPLLYRCQLFGYDFDRLRSILDSACYRCGFSETVRFWKQNRGE